jgi:hypothetical protein
MGKTRKEKRTGKRNTWRKGWLKARSSVSRLATGAGRA